MRRAVIILCAVLTVGTARAEPDAETVYAGDPAPFSGLLIPAGRALELNEAELQVAELTRTLKSKDKECRDVEAVYVLKLEEATAPPPWYDKPSVRFWAGVAIGVLATGAAIQGASTLTR